MTLYRHRTVGRVTKREPVVPTPLAAEDRMAQVQRELTRAKQDVHRLEAERDSLALHLWLDARRPQAEIAAILDTADRSAGGDGVTYAAVQRRLYRGRESVG